MAAALTEYCAYDTIIPLKYNYLFAYGIPAFIVMVGIMKLPKSQTPLLSLKSSLTVVTVSLFHVLKILKRFFIQFSKARVDCALFTLIKLYHHVIDLKLIQCQTIDNRFLILYSLTTQSQWNNTKSSTIVGCRWKRVW